MSGAAKAAEARAERERREREKKEFKEAQELENLRKMFKRCAAECFQCTLAAVVNPRMLALAGWTKGAMAVSMLTI